MAVSCNPNIAGSHSLLGKLLHDDGRLEEAEQAYRTALRLYPDDVKTMGELSDVIKDTALRLKLKNGEVSDRSRFDDLMSEAILIADKVLSLAPGYTVALSVKASALLCLDRVSDWTTLNDFDRLIKVFQIDVPEKYTNLKDFNEQLLSRCRYDPNLKSNSYRKSFNKGQRILSLQDDAETTPVGFLMDTVNRTVNQYRRELCVDPDHPIQARNGENWRIEAWGTILERGGHHNAHIHGAGWISGVYYGVLPKVMKTKNEDRAGWIEFGRPKNYFATNREQEFHFVRPQEGLMVLFPSYVFHRTVPLKSDGKRFTVAFDIIPCSD